MTDMIAGFDVGINSLGFAKVNFGPGGDVLCHFEQLTIPKARSKHDKTDQLYAWIKTRMTQASDAQAMGYEAVWVGKNVQTTIQLAEVCGAIRFWAWVMLRLHCYRIQPATAKKAVATGRATKHGVQEAIARRFFAWVNESEPLPDEVENSQHACDAVAVAVATYNKFWAENI